MILFLTYEKPTPAFFFLILLLPGCKEDEPTVVTGFSTDKNSLIEGAVKNNQVITVNAIGSLNFTINVPYKIKEGLSSGDFSDAFHVFSLVWDRNKITWYLDNKSFKEFSNTTSTSGYPFNKPFFFIMNVAVGGNWPGAPDNTTVFPQELVVDYIRVFQ